MSEMYPAMTPPYGFKLKRPHFTYHEMNGCPWAECFKHDAVYQECLDSGGFDIGMDCVGCVVEERIIKLLEDEYDGGSHEMGIVPHLIALIKGEGENKHYPLPLPPKTANNTETAPLSRPMKFKGGK